MRAFIEQSKILRAPNPSGRQPRQGATGCGDLTGMILSLQGMVGNRAVLRLLNDERHKFARAKAHGALAPEPHPFGVQPPAYERAYKAQNERSATATRIQRKEVDASVIRGSLPPQDWSLMDRAEWDDASANGTEQSLSPTNSFMRAAWYNTQHLKPEEYQSITERHDYYDLISYVIEHDPNTPAAARDVRFFHATTAVTGSPGIGSVDRPVGAIKLGADTRQILRDVNAELFAMNMHVIHDLLISWREPRDPQAPGAAISAFDFDIRMVESEQGLVENFITQFKDRFTPKVVQEINSTLDPTVFGHSFNFSNLSFQWAIKALGVPALDFTKRDHRQAIGIASVHIFHRKSEQDYLAFMKARMQAANPRRTP